MMDELQGAVSARALREDEAADQAEKAGLHTGTLIYHYFDGLKQVGTQPLLTLIAQERRVGSRLQCLSEAEITDSVQNASDVFRPHYGDGAYGSLHTNFATAHPEVELAHGIRRQLRFRAVLLVERPDRFRKFKRTGGVVRSIPRAPRLPPA